MSRRFQSVRSVFGSPHDLLPSLVDRREQLVLIRQLSVNIKRHNRDLDA